MLTALLAALSAPEQDRVASLPGYGEPPSPQFSGYLDAGAAEPGTKLHYWFAAAETADWAKRPVVLWLNGGPGSSSLLGMLQEQGPLIIDRNGKLMRNPYAWTTLVNLVALESPAGVGFSYCAAMKAGGSCSNTDVSTARAAHAGLQDFFSAKKFPELAANDFYITGESYAGVYCPTLAAEIVSNPRGGQRIRLVGMAVGDPCTDNAAQRQSMDMLWYAHKHGLVPEAEYHLLTASCGYEPPPSHLTAGQWRVAADGRRNASRRGSGTWNYRTAAYLNSQPVRKALHVAGAPSAWPGPAPGWSYSSSYAACNVRAPPGTDSMVDFYRRLAPALPGRIVVFNGAPPPSSASPPARDTDPCVSYEGTREALLRVGFKEVQPTRPWFYNMTAAPPELLARKDVLFGGLLASAGAGAQFGGQVTDYEHGLSFATVHGSGHMVPTFRPRAALTLLRHVVENSTFAPPVPSDAALAAMGGPEFDGFLDKWVAAAAGPDYVGKRGRRR
ncbi:hypothetical protein EMIHUDRAFT_461557 [Emiliania huxleyi CCMP1516]|uniref:Carboxypeptidase n=2 Tax=Emiliania huxleyi TaxID=2903 RepID=A0A0D3ITU5_EMIH1|nr:hypothetical protein EMIHUDRAFT_461557 [Emiliania huxleyi CCMP1516]EOD14680.1 hypothetical protein EMIHUDRAFT_461557 [Emiliania huxleyi CCMP1516]|eukprot:XP_005767109.1 hypothetical protein EMIHUDRAFT_461557 [Emiliania huxleyi CCMP1516]